VHEGFENYRLRVELLGEYLAHGHIKKAVGKKVDPTADGVEIEKPFRTTFKKVHPGISGNTAIRAP
jgi:hypothetical protein